MWCVNTILVIQNQGNDCDKKSHSIICVFFGGRFIVGSYIDCQE